MGAASMVLLGAVRVDFDAVLMCFLSLTFYIASVSIALTNSFQQSNKNNIINTFESCVRLSIKENILV